MKVEHIMATKLEWLITLLLGHDHTYLYMIIRTEGTENPDW